VSRADAVALRAALRQEEEEGGPRPLTGFFFGNVTNKLRLQKDEGRYLGEARPDPSRSAQRAGPRSPCAARRRRALKPCLSSAQRRLAR